MQVDRLYTCLATGNEEQKGIYRARLEIILHDVKRTEQFMNHFYESFRLPVDKLGIRKLDWLS